MSKNADITMMKHIGSLPQQFEKCLRMNYSFTPMYDKSYANVVISGLGGSAIGGDILRNLAIDQASIPVSVNRGYGIPAYVSEDTLFIAVSYSGNTEETLAALAQAESRQADIICVTSGGRLAERADEMDWGKVILPDGLPPRAATGYLFAPLAIILERIHLLTGVTDSLKETVTVLTSMWGEYGPSSPVAENQAVHIAKELKRSIPVIWGTEGGSEAAALRWKTQINENAKSPAYYNAFPELNHNELVGFEVPDSLLSQLVVVLLCDRFDHVRIKKRLEISAEVIGDKVKKVIKINSRGESFLARMYSLCYLGDLVSVYLAAEYDLDPNPVQVIDYLKARLATFA